MEILSYGSRVKVISPDALKKKLIANYEQALKHYHS
jgi:predicted DNA-binding transcriptional regulator YafY